MFGRLTVNQSQASLVELYWFGKVVLPLQLSIVVAVTQLYVILTQHADSAAPELVNGPCAVLGIVT